MFQFAPFNLPLYVIKFTITGGLIINGCEDYLNLVKSH